MNRPIERALSHDIATMSVYRRALLLGLAASLFLVATLMDRGYITVTARVQLVDLRDLAMELTCDFEDALDIVDAAKPWMTELQAWDAARLRAQMLGWTYDAMGWLQGRHFHVMPHWDGTRLSVMYVHMPRGDLMAALYDPGLSVCGGAMLRPFPTLPETLAQFNRGKCAELDRMHVMAAYRVLCPYFDMCAFV